MNYFNPRHLRAFVTVVELGSMARASETLHLGQPALSQAISKLEELAGLKLFDRSTRRLSLTPAGKVFYDDARNVLEQNARLFVHLRQWSLAQEGSVCLMSIPSVAQCLLPRALSEFGALHPQVRIDVHDLPDRQLADQIRAGQGDIAIQTQGFEEDAGWTLAILRDPLRWVARAGHRCATKASVGPADIRDETLILLRKGSVFREMMEPIRQRQFAGNKYIEVEQPTTLLSMVSMGMGIGLLPALFCPANESVVHRPWDQGRVSRTILLTRPGGRALMPAHKRFVTFLLGAMAEGTIELPAGVVRLKHPARAVEAFLRDE